MPTDFVQLILAFFIAVKLYLFEPGVCLYAPLLLLSSLNNGDEFIA